ncbi:hypothetical protein pipiens_004307 [Culex pipiens pipiens]|uniref:Uncharacterized protein n=1 Tax=Culex pipiens pipiens TaxID=38569 RepID=A0ABD1CAW6_CULPP
MPPPSVFKVLFEEAAQKSHSVMLLAHGADLYFNQLSCCRTLAGLKSSATATYNAELLFSRCMMVTTSSPTMEMFSHYLNFN